jgi:TP901 family phage tail tape measure protein
MAERTWTGRLLLRGEERGISKSANKAGRAIGGLTRQLKTFGTLAAVTGGVALFAGSAQKIRQFEKSISDLSAITGAAGADLDKLTEASKRIGQTTTLSASQAAEAFKLIASAKPDLLENVDALTATTEAAVTLAEAAGLDLPTAASALGESLNQFGEGAESAGKFINILAAGAKFGSSEISQTSEALINAGTVAKLAGLSFEETNAAIQAMAAAGIKGSDAGTKLRSVLIKLQVQANDEFNPAVVGINEALQNLGDANLSVTEKVAIFGERSVATADILIDQLDVLNRVEEQVTGTSEAYDQAAKRVDNLDGDIKRLTSAFEAFQLNMANGTLPILRTTIQGFTDIFNAIAATTGSEGINKATNQFNLFTAALKTTFVAGNVLVNVFDAIADVLGFVGRAIVAAFEGDFELISLGFEELKSDLNQEFIDIGDFAANTFNPELAAEVKANTEAFFRDPVVTVIDETNAIIKEKTLTAGEELASAEAAAAELRSRKKFEDFERLLERVRESNRTELEILQENNALKIAELQLLEDNTILTESEASEKRLVALEEFEAARLKITMQGASQLQKFEALTAQNKTKFILSEAVKLTQGVAQNSKTMFRINKVAAIANAVINTGQAITKTMAAYPFPINVALGALTAAAGFAQIQAIKSAQFSGGGTGTTPSAAGSVPVLNNQPAGGANEVPLDALLAGQGGGANQRIDINIDGLNEAGLLPADATRNLIASINESLGDGVNLNVNANEGG